MKNNSYKHSSLFWLVRRRRRNEIRPDFDLIRIRDRFVADGDVATRVRRVGEGVAVLTGGGSSGRTPCRPFFKLFFFAAGKLERWYKAPKFSLVYCLQLKLWLTPAGVLFE
jgi:hypothetical protein